MLVALILILIALIIYVIVTYNIFVKLKKQINNSYSVIDVYLKKRFDLIPNLVEITKEYANYEKDVLTKITEYRTAYNQKNDRDSMYKLNKEYDNLMLIVENYPELKASEQFAKLQKSLIKVESELQAARRIYNNDVTKYNLWNRKILFYYRTIFRWMQDIIKKIRINAKKILM